MKRAILLLTHDIVWMRLTFIVTAFATVAAAANDQADNVVFFETRIRPVLVEHCYACHSAATAELKGGLRLDYRDGLLQGGDSGPAVVPRQPDASLLLDALRNETLEMPPAGKLPAAIIADFEDWIRRGAVDPRDTRPSPAESSALAWKLQFAERSRWWSLQPLKQTLPPVVAADAWSRDEVDRFVLAALDEAGLSPAAPADGATLFRRLSLVLTGLPPRPDVVTSLTSAFAKAPDRTLSELVDELLDSPHFGERFARHWMDVIRYTDTYGYEWDNPAKGSWEYRDYLIRAFNNDIGFDQLIREQLAGDLLPRPRINHAEGLNESLIGPMFYHLGEHRHGSSLDFNGIHQEMINNKVDAFSKAFLAMTVACARCHDHKLDAISQADYYALAGVFMSPRWSSRVIDAPGKYEEQITELEHLRGAIRDALAQQWRAARDDLPLALRTWAADNPDALAAATIDDVAYPLARLVEATDGTISKEWQAFAEQWRMTRDARCVANAEQFAVLADFREPEFPDGWTTEGDGIASGYVIGGEPLISLSGDALIERLLPRGFHTHALSSKLPGAVRLPEQASVPGQFVSLQLRGSEWSGYLVVPQNAFNAETVTFLTSGNAKPWITLADRPLANGVTRVFTEVATSSLNPNFPPRTGLARAAGVKLPDEDDGLEKRSWFSLTAIVTHDTAGTPQETLDAFAPLLANLPAGNESLAADKADAGSAAIELPPTLRDPPATRDAAWQRVGDWFGGALDRWCDHGATPADVELLNWLLAQKLLPNRFVEPIAESVSTAQADMDASAQEENDVASRELVALVARYREVEACIGFPRTANSMDERGIAPLDYRLNVRGNPDEEGPVVPRDFLSVFANANDVAASDGSGRLELANFLSSGRHPQTARVYVNRVWQWIFGRGLVATPSDFGKLGDRPSHPELLDWLAARFMAEGWSTKKLVRRLVLSQTFRQSGEFTRAAAERDPDNRLLHHYPTRRLEAEAIRDSLLAVSGRLDSRLYGPPINPPRAVEDPAKRLFSGPLDSEGRRSIYMKMSIMDPPKFLVCFNLPDLKLPTGRRDVTNVPAQALALLNDPLVVQLAAQWAEGLVRDECGTPEDRVRSMFLRALGRAPTDTEVQRWTDAVTRFAQSRDVMRDQDAWADLAHAFFNSKEFIYYR